MINGLYSAASAMEASSRQHDLISQNLAHAQMPGYRRQSLIGDTVESTFSDELKGAVNYQSLGTNSKEVAIDFSAGALEQTGQPLDVALRGDGFFVVDGPNGPLYTRNGVFQLDTQGRLVTADMLPVQGSGGAITLPPDASFSTIRIAEDGRIYSGNTEIDRIAVVNFSDTKKLQQAGVTLFQAPDDLKPQPADVRMVQGSRERSNVSPFQEMIELIATQRRQEAAQKTMSAMSESVGKHINTQGGI